MGMGSHQSAAAISTTWLTPQPIIDALGGWQSFDLDPCAAPAPRPWFTAWQHNAEADADGLALDWFGRVWLNFPYDDPEAWLRKMVEHDRGTVLMFARTETDVFHRYVWERATGLLFLRGRLFFHHADGARARHNGGAPSVLCAYGQDDLDRLAASDLDGALVPLRFARFIAVAGLDVHYSWADAMREFLASSHGPVSVSDAYRHFARHPKAERNPNWRAKVRQKLQQCGSRIERNQYVASAA
jgi:hypothetical protein